ncbi:hypothetical protein LIX60_25395 [Streptomyces sp. S07_1.15]|uniref:hypothetical protein n=1 Tax=Streptomyces sp. S07_1.15 TaxID=2873925 RepID=UPI001D135A1D|nr:hypothetical protein [Streptomyces sp. S07_1.15]MCC3654739.1 hypothetical protein [Streptomyces sp. S07_1.15]
MTVTTMPSPAERSAANRRRHHEARQATQAARGPRGVAASWWDHARAVAAAEERRTGTTEAWDDLILTLENYAARYSQ